MLMVIGGEELRRLHRRLVNGSLLGSVELASSKKEGREVHGSGDMYRFAASRLTYFQLGAWTRHHVKEFTDSKTKRVAESLGGLDSKHLGFFIKKIAHRLR